MPTAKLLKPKRLNFLGRIWEKGKIEPVDNHTAVLLNRNDRFKVDGLDPALADVEGPTLEPSAPEKPRAKAALGKAIREAIDQVDADDEANFGSNGAPTAAAISAILGYDVTDEEVVLALNPNAKAASAAKTTAQAAAEVTPRKGGVKIKRVEKTEPAKADPAAKPDGTSEPVVEV